MRLKLFGKSREIDGNENNMLWSHLPHPECSASNAPCTESFYTYPASCVHARRIYYKLNCERGRSTTAMGFNCESGRSQ